MIVAWTAALAVYLAAAIALTLGLIGVVSLALPPGKFRTACQLALALLGGLVATIMLWN
jgi:hypothetical protein